MSSNRKKIIEPWEIVRETMWTWTKNRNFAYFCPSKKPLFSLFLQILPFPAEIQKKKNAIRLVSTNPIFRAHGLPNWWKKSTLKKSWRTDKKKNIVHFCSCDDVMKTNGIKLRPCVPLCGRSFLSKRFSESVHLFQRYCLKTASSAHRITLKRHLQCLNEMKRNETKWKK